MIIGRYLFRQVTQPFAAILGVLLAVFASYTVAVFLSEAVNGVLPAGVIAELTGLKALISLEVLIPASLYISVIVAFARLHADGEFTAMAAIGVERTTIIRAVLTLSALLAVIVASLSLFVRPWSYETLHRLSSEAATLLDVDAMQSGTFYVTGSGSRVILFDGKAGSGGSARNVFVRLRDQDLTRVILAQRARSLPGSTPSGISNVTLEDANIYDFHHGSALPEGSVHVGSITLDIHGHRPVSPEYSAVSADSRHVARSSDPEDVAEFQWRLFTPVSTLLLGLVAIPLARVRQRERRHSQFGYAILIYFSYYLMSTAARTWVQHGSVPRFPGIWWVSVVLAMLVLTLMSAASPARLLERWRA